MSQKRQSSGNHEVTEKRRKVCEEVIEVESNSNDSTHVTCNGNADNTETNDNTCNVNGINSTEVVSDIGTISVVTGGDVKSTLEYLRDCFPFQKFQLRLPPIIVKHQIYCFVDDRDLVDQVLSSLMANGEIVQMNCSHLTLIIFTKDYKSQVIQHMTELRVNEDLISEFLSLINTIASAGGVIDHQRILQSSKISNEDIKYLIQEGLLQMCDVSSYECALPHVSVFLRCFSFGRNAVLTMVKRSKNQQILEEDLTSRKLPKLARLGIVFHIRDIIGAELVERVNTAYGQLLRLPSTSVTT